MSQVDVQQWSDEETEVPEPGLGQDEPQTESLAPEVNTGDPVAEPESPVVPDEQPQFEPEQPGLGSEEPEVPAEGQQEAPEPSPVPAPEPEAPAPPTVQERASNLSEDLKSAAARFTHGVAEFVPVSAGRSRRNLVHYAVEGVLAVAVVVLAISAFGLHSDKQKLNGQLGAAIANPQQLVQNQTNDIISHVAALMQVPTNETPTVADVTDASQARTQSNFFANAENGDKVLMYVKAGEAILYRPGSDKIVLVAPLTFNNQTAAGTTTTAKH